MKIIQRAGLLAILIVLAHSATSLAQVTSTAKVVLQCGTNFNRITLSAPLNPVTNYTLQFPKTAPPARGAFLFVDSSGVGLMDWMSPGGINDVLTIDSSTGLPIWKTRTQIFGSMGWMLTGNIGTDPLLNFLGTTDAQPLIIRTTNLERMRVASDGKVGIGTNAPSQLVEVKGGNLLLSNSGTAGEMRFAEPILNGTNYTAFKAQAQSTDVTYTLPNAAPGSSGMALVSTTAGVMSWAAMSSGTVTSVGLSLPASVFSISSSPVTGSGTLTGTFANQNANTFFAGPGSGGAGTPSFRTMVATDLPDLNTLAWKLTGNTPTAAYNGTTGSFIGTTNTQPLVIATTNTTTAQPIQFMTGNAERMRLAADGKVGIGTNAPSQLIEAKDGNMLLSNSGTAGEMRFAEPSGSGANYTAFKAQAQGVDITYTLPSTPPSSNGMVLSSTAAGIMSWASAATGTVTSVGLALPASVFTISNSPVTGSGTLTGTFANQNANTIFAGPSNGAAAAPTFRTMVAADLPDLGTLAWKLTGNSGTTPGTNFVGTTDNQSFEIHVNETGVATGGNRRVMRYEPNSFSANLIGGYNGNKVANAAVTAATISGGGANGTGSAEGYGSLTNINEINDVGGVISGGIGNKVGRNDGDYVTDHYATVGGGYYNQALGGHSTISGGEGHVTNGEFAFVGGGYRNTAGANFAAKFSTVGGGANNKATGVGSFVGGGGNNTADFSGAPGNTASGAASIVVGGASNRATGEYGAVVGGYIDSASGKFSFVANGEYNTASGDYASVLGGSRLRLGARSVGYNGQTSTSMTTNISGSSQVAYFGDVNMWLGNVDGTARELRFYEPNTSFTYSGTHYSAFKAGAQSANITYTLPTALGGGSTNYVLLDSAGNGSLRWTSISSLFGINAWTLTGNAPTAAYNGTSGSFMGTTNTQPLVIATTNTTTTQPIQFMTGNSERFRITGAGLMGWGTTSPISQLHFVNGGSDESNDVIIEAVNSNDPTDGGEFITRRARGTTSSRSAVTTDDDLGGMKFFGYDGTAFSSGAQFDVLVDGSVSSGDVPTRFEFQMPDGTVYIKSSGKLGVNESSPNARLDVKEDRGTVAIFNRTGNDGTILSFEQAGSEEGKISVSGSTVTYSGFTGAHYAWVDQSIERGMLVSMTGDNRHLSDRAESEIVYGVRTTMRPNDPAVLGGYLAISEPDQPQSSSNPHLIMAVGNGDIWVTDKGGDIKPGDYLITSTIPGHAMRDNGIYDTSYVVARAAEKVDWSKIQGDPSLDGAKRAKISVFFESFAKVNNTVSRQDVTTLKKELDALKEEVKKLRSSLYYEKAPVVPGVGQ